MPTETTVIGDFAELWYRWTEIVRLFAVRHERRHAVDPREYQTLHAAMVEHCRTVVELSPDSRQGNQARHLLEVLSPWVNVESLARAERELVCQLFEHCQQIQRSLDGPSAARNHRSRTLLIAGLVALVGLGLLTLCHGTSLASPHSGNPLTWPLISTLNHWFHVACNSVTRNPFHQRLLLGGILALLATMAVIVTSARKN